MQDESVVVAVEPEAPAKRKYVKRSPYWKGAPKRKNDITRERVNAMVSVRIPTKPRAKVYYRRGPWEILRGKKWQPFFTADAVEEQVKRNLTLMFPASKIARYRGKNGVK